jgi:hypothetical protein
MPEQPRGFTLEVPIDASAIPEEEAREQQLKVVAQTREGEIHAQAVKLGKDRRGSATFRFPKRPGPLRVLVGPAGATDEELAAMQTLAVDVQSRRWADKRQLALEPFAISPYYWYWWLRWCRWFTIRGKVVCPDHKGVVPGAEVCAYDVDWWWWWSSKQLVGCTTTDIDGTFELRFRWCCGFWPWWWWRYRIWEFDPLVAERLGAVLERDPRLELGRASTVPTLDVFEPLLARGGPASGGALASVDPAQLDQIRGALLQKLPAAPELASWRIWPWWPWWPWWDCTPDIVFRVTQDCRFPGAVVVDEGIWETRWDIPTSLDVTLVANDLACCRPLCGDLPCPEGECIDISAVCADFISIDSIGGNGGAPAGLPVGYAGGPAPYRSDRPFAGVLPIEKANDFLNVDYYEIEYSDDVMPRNWQPMPVGGAANFCRHWLQPAVPLNPWPHANVDFKFLPRSGHNVVESREHWEATVGLPPGAFWTINANLVVPIDSTKFADGTYWFRVVGWQDDGAGGVTNRRVLPWCDTDIENEWVLTFDNRVIPDLGAPRPCLPLDAETVHICTREPATAIVSVTIDGVEVGECGTHERTTGTLEIEFEASDLDGHLASYSLTAHWGANHVRDLLAQPGSSVALVSADYVGPTYAAALTQGATRPTWNGGRMRLTVPVVQAFPEPCCYELRLEAWKRNVVGYGGGSDCGYGCQTDPDWNVSEFTIGVGVCAPRHDIGHLAAPEAVAHVVGPGPVEAAG